MGVLGSLWLLLLTPTMSENNIIRSNGVVLESYVFTQFLLFLNHNLVIWLNVKIFYIIIMENVLHKKDDFDARIILINPQSFNSIGTGYPIY